MEYISKLKASITFIFSIFFSDSTIDLCKLLVGCEKLTCIVRSFCANLNTIIRKWFLQTLLKGLKETLKNEILLLVQNYVNMNNIMH